MNFLMTVWVALKALRKNNFALLTVLGVVIGVCAVITLVNLGNGRQTSSNGHKRFVDQFAGHLPGQRHPGGIRTGYGTVTTLIPEDAEAIPE